MPLCGGGSDSISKIDLKRSNLCIRRTGEGNFFGQIKLMCINDEDLYQYCINTQAYFLERSYSTKTTFLSYHNRLRIARIIKDLTLEIIVDEIKSNGGVFGLLLDSAKDIAGKHQFSVVVKYVNVRKDKGFEIFERTVMFTPFKDLTGATIYHSVKNRLASLGLEMENISGKYLENL